LVSQLVFVDIQSLVGLWAPQMDLLENEIISDVVVLSVVLEEVKNKNLSLYNRLRAIIDNPTRHFFVFANEHHKWALFIHSFFALFFS
jgi:hypothetical protein